MKPLLAITMLILAGFAAAKDVYVDGYIRKDGTYVYPYNRSAPDHNVWNNYSTQGNINPYTGAYGTRDPFKTYNMPRSGWQGPYFDQRSKGYNW